jgi:hypothetical protein
VSRSLPPSPVVPADTLAAGRYLPGRTCTACGAWAQHGVALRHVANCRAGDVR